MSVELRWPGGRCSAVLGGAPLGRGGEGSVWPLTGTSLPGHDGPLVAKLYHEPGAGDRAAKIAAMLGASPSSDAVCWPVAEVWQPPPGTPPGTAARFAGYAMQALPSASFRPWAQLAHTADRRRCAPRFSVRYAVTACRNLAAAMAAVHAAGHVVGDVNESNVFVGVDATVRLVDADSAQIRAADGRTFRCLVGKPDFTAPELIGRPLAGQQRTAASDVFGFAVLTHQMLTGGAHPTDGVPHDNTGEPPAIGTRIANRWLPGLDPAASGPLTAAARIPTDAIPPQLQALLIAALDIRPTARPTLAQFAAALGEVETYLAPCPAEPNHAIDSREKACRWCQHAAAGQPDPWCPQRSAAQQRTSPQARLAQTALPPVQFAAPGGGPVIRRAPAAAPTAWPGHPLTAQAAHTPWPAHPGIGPQLPATVPGRPPLGTPASLASPRRPTLLVGSDGIVRPRPPLLVLARQQPRLAARCAWAELPDGCKPVWPLSSLTTSVTGARQRFVRPVAALLAVAAVCAATAFAFPLLAEALSVLIFGTPATSALRIVGIAGAVTAASASAVLAGSRHFRRRGSRGQIPGTLTWPDVGRFATVAAVYGPLLLCAAAAVAALLLLSAAGKVLESVFDGRR